ncbi:MAG: hypothetical protein WC755_00120 [Candidatus Woesearchaeota archaeon]|jgi:hypothetical protein
MVVKIRSNHITSAAKVSGLANSGFFLELPTLEKLESVLGKTNNGPTLIGNLDDETVSLGVRNRFDLFDEKISDKIRIECCVDYDSERCDKQTMRLADIPSKYFDKQKRITIKGIEHMFTPLKEMVVIRTCAYLINGLKTITENRLIYDYSKDKGNPFFVYVGSCNDKGNENEEYPKTLQNIAPTYSGILVASSANELTKRELKLEEFISEFVDKLIPATQYRLKEIIKNPKEIIEKASQIPKVRHYGLPNDD